MPGPEDSPEVLARFHETLALVEIIARQVGRVCGRFTEHDDLVSYGREGLLDAARRFEPERGVPFRAYANYRVRGAMIDGLRSASRLPRKTYERLRAYEAATRVSEGMVEDVQRASPPGSTRAEAERALGEHLARMATAMAAGLVTKAGIGEEGELTAVSRGESPEEATSRAELRHLLEKSLEDLPDQEATLVRRHYFEGERFDHVAAELGLSKSWASRLHTRAIGRLSKRLRRDLA